MSNSLKKHFLDFRRIRIEYLIFLSAYALSALSSPMPAVVSPWIIAVGAGLLVGSLLILKAAVGSGMAESLNAKTTIALFCILLFGPLYFGISAGNKFEHILRDVIPLFFLFSTAILFLYSITTGHQKNIIRLGALVVIAVGLVRSFDFLISAYSRFGSLSVVGANMKGGLLAHMELEQSGSINTPTSPEQVPQDILPSGHVPQDILPSGHVPLDILGMYDPAVLFSCIFLCSIGLILIIRSWRDSVAGLGCLGVGLLVGYELAMLGLRSYMLVILVSMLIVLWSQLHEEGFYKRLLPLGAILFLIFFNQIYDSVQLMFIKQLAVGSNAKLAEWSAVFSTLQTDIGKILFGIGWGGTFQSPISDNARFTHSLFSFYILKSGIVGLIVFASLLASLVYKIVSTKVSDSLSRVERRVMLVSCISPLVIGILFEPSYKMLSYGVILGLLCLTLLPVTRVSSPNN